MARFCTSCGSAVSEDLKFCSQCGAEMGAAQPSAPAARPEPVLNTPVVPAPATPVPPAAPAAKSPALKIILIIVLVLVLIVVASIGACVYGVYRAKKVVNEAIKMDESGKSVEIQTPGGPIKMGERSVKTPTEVGGVPVYPGAVATEAGAQFSFGDKFQIGGQEFATDDSVEQVVAFYKEKYGSELNSVESDGHHRLSVNTGTKEVAHVVTIDVSSDPDSGKTKIMMSHLGGRGAQ
jgi:hypothetical protein